MYSINQKKYQNDLNARPVSIDEFNAAFCLANSISKNRVKNIAQIRGNVSLETGTTGSGSYQFTDIPINHLGLTLAGQYRNDIAGFMSIMRRFVYLLPVLKDPRIEPWREYQDEEGCTVQILHPALLAVAAKYPLLSEEGFLCDRFFMTVQDVSKFFKSPCGSLLITETEMEDYIWATTNTLAV